MSSTYPLVGITADVARPADRPVTCTLAADYTDALARAGAIPVALAPIDGGDAALDRLLDRLDGVVFSGGDDIDPRRYGRAATPEVTLLDPRREAFELALAARALARRIPILGICNGIQTLNVVRGGTLHVHLEPGSSSIVHRPPRGERVSHAVRLEPGCRLAFVFGASDLAVNTFHHQAIDEPGRGVRVCGRSPDGLAEAIEVTDHPWAFAVQWHPEKMPDDPVQRRLLDAFCAAAREQAAARG